VMAATRRSLPSLSVTESTAMDTTPAILGAGVAAGEHCAPQHEFEL
jgi:hypothetical protein